jgi:hypothetical protein
LRKHESKTLAEGYKRHFVVAAAAVVVASVAVAVVAEKVDNDAMPSLGNIRISSC